MPSQALTPGEVFAGRYRVERIIGAGGMGTVFEAEHLETERRVALKVLLPQSLVSEGARERFKQEARVAGRLRHPNIVDVLDAGVDDVTGMPYLVMELLHGEDLGSRLERFGPLPIEEAVHLLQQIASALDCLHERSIVHRDLKPENLFLTWAEDGSPVIKLLDFGVAKVIAEGKTSAFTLDAQGTPAYMAPEQFAEQIRISPATDIYALGMLAFTLLTGKHYWGAEVERGMNVFMLARIAEAGPKDPASVRAGRSGAALPAGFDEWFATITAIVPGERYPTATVAVEVLAETVGMELLPIPPPHSRSFHLFSEATPRDVRQSLPRDVRQSLPRDARQSFPRDARPSLPRDVRQSPTSGADDLASAPAPPRAPRGDAGRSLLREGRGATASSPTPDGEIQPHAGNTVPSSRRRRGPFWRQPAVMTPALLGIAAVIALAIGLARGRPPEADPQLAPPPTDLAASSEPSPRAEVPVPTAPVSAEPLASTAPPPEAPSTPATAESPTTSPPQSPPLKKPWVAPVRLPPVAPTGSKRPKYTRE